MATPRMAPAPVTRQVRIIAQDPSVVDTNGKVITSVVDLPFELLERGPKGARVYVVDYDSSTGKFYPPAELMEKLTPAEPSDAQMQALLSDFGFHAHNAYAIVMRTLARFEFALGRRLSWGFDGHQLHVAPHAFVDANAFYSQRDRGLFFGYFDTEVEPGKKQTVYTSLSHDVVAHETTHALVDGLRRRFMEPSSPQQAAFHEGFADVVALLSVFSLPGVVQKSLDLREKENGRSGDSRAVSRKWLTRDRLADSVLLGLGEIMGDPGSRINALRRSVRITPEEAVDILKDNEEHRLGEILVAAIMNTFLDVWVERNQTLGAAYGEEGFDRERVAEEGRIVADHLLTMAIRALDYTPTVHIEFHDFLSALLTADLELQPEDRFDYRPKLLKSFAAFGITPTSKGFNDHVGAWEPPEWPFDYSNTVLESMQRDPDEVYRFLWQNRNRLELHLPAYTRVESVRPCIRVSSDGLILRETVAEYVQILNVEAGELDALPWDTPRYDGKTPEPVAPVKPPGMRDTIPLRLFGGGALVFSDRGEVKYHIRNKVLNSERQRATIDYLWNSGFFNQAARAGFTDTRRFAHMHLARQMGLRRSSAMGGFYADTF